MTALQISARLGASIGNFFKTSAVRSMLSIIRANVFIQIISLVTVPILTRVYAPESYGVFTLFVSASTLLTQLGQLRLDAAIDSPDDDRDAAAIFHLCLLISTVVVGLVATASALYPAMLGVWFGKPELIDYLPYLSVAVAIASSGNVLAAWLSRNRDFKTQSDIRMIGAMCDVGAKLSFGLIGMQRYGQIFGSLVSSSIVTTLLWRATRKLDLSPLLTFDMGRILKMARRYRYFSLVNFPTMFIESTALMLPAFVIGGRLGASAVGLYYVADRLTAAPAYAVLGAIRPVFKREAAIALNDTGSCYLLLFRTLAVTTLIGVIYATGAFVLTHTVFDWLFDEKWSDGIAIAQTLAIPRALEIVVNPITPVLLLRQRHFLNLAIQLLFIVLAFTGLTIGGMRGSLETAVVLFAVATAIKYVAELLCCVLALGHWPAAPIRWK